MTVGNGRLADVRIHLDVLELVVTLRMAQAVLSGVAGALTVAGYPEQAGQVRGIAEAAARARDDVLAESEKRRSEARSHG